MLTNPGVKHPEANTSAKKVCRHCNHIIGKLSSNDLRVSSTVTEKHWVHLQSYWICPKCFSPNPVGKEVYVPNRPPKKEA